MTIILLEEGPMNNDREKVGEGQSKNAESMPDSNTELFPFLDKIVFPSNRKLAEKVKETGKITDLASLTDQ